MPARGKAARPLSPPRKKWRNHNLTKRRIAGASAQTLGEIIMSTNVIAFTARPFTARRTALSGPTRDNVVSLAAWLGRTVPRRTPNGVFFVTRVLVSPGHIA